MLDEKDMTAIASLITASEERMGSKLDETKQDIMQGVAVLMESKFGPRFNLLAEGQQAIREQLPPAEDWEALDARVSALEAMVKKLSREITHLKKAE